jgi:hypothetical protein
MSPMFVGLLLQHVVRVSRGHVGGFDLLALGSNAREYIMMYFNFVV